MAALQFPAGRMVAQSSAGDLSWHEALDFCDRSSLTLVFGAVAGDALPDWVRAHIALNLVENTKRLQRAHTLQDQVSELSLIHI